MDSVVPGDAPDPGAIVVSESRSQIGILFAGDVIRYVPRNGPVSTLSRQQGDELRFVQGRRGLRVWTLELTIAGSGTAHVGGTEAASAAALSGIAFRRIPAPRGLLSAEQVAAALEPDPYDVDHVGLVTVENTHQGRAGRRWNGCGGWTPPGCGSRSWQGGCGCSPTPT